MQANDVQLVRVYTQRVGSTVSDETFPHNQAFQVAVEGEAGVTIHGTAGTPYNVQIVVRDLTDNSIILAPPNPAASIAGTFGDANWPVFDRKHLFSVPAQGAGKQGHIYQVITYLRAGLGPDPNVSFAESPLFAITAL